MKPGAIKSGAKGQNETLIWVNAKREGKCAECRTDIYVGDRIVWDMEHHKAYCGDCGGDLTA